jgi:hypothetical protein
MHVLAPDTHLDNDVVMPLNGVPKSKVDFLQIVSLQLMRVANDETAHLNTSGHRHSQKPVRARRTRQTEPPP